MKHAHVPVQYPGGHLLLLVMLTSLLASDSASQHAKPFFGPRIDFLPGISVASVSSAMFPGDVVKLVMSPAKREEISFYTIGKAGNPTRTETQPMPSTVSSSQWHESPGRGQLVLFSLSPPSAQIVRSARDNSPLTVPAPLDADRIAFADITNDRLSDILFFGKQKAGITMNRGTKEGFAASGTLVLSDLSASDVVATDLNGDLIADLFVADWLSNKIVLYLGIGRGIFSEQVSVVLSDEPSLLAFHSEKGGKSRVAVSLPVSRQLQVFTINALGEFKTESILPCPGQPGKILFADIDRDGTAELLTSTEEQLVVFAIEKGRYHREPFLYSAGGRISDWTISDLDGDKLLDAVVATSDPSGVILLGNSSHAGSIEWPHTYSVGQSPRGLAAGDFNGDGRKDIAVVSATPGSLGLLMNQGGGRMSGPVFTQVGENPVSVKYVGGTQEYPQTFVLSHSPSTHVTVVRGTTPFPFGSFEIPTALNPIVLSAVIDPSRGKLSFLTRNSGDEKQNLSLSLFDEISEEQFIETSLQPNPPRRVTSLTAFDMSGDGQRDLVFSSFEKNRGKSTISLSRGVDRFSFAPHSDVFSFSDTVGAIRFIRVAYIDDDARADIMVVLGPPMASVLFLYGTDGGVRDSVEWLRGVDIPGEDALIAEDLNNDGKNDVCFVDLITQSVVAAYGTGKGRFLNRRTIHDGAGVVALLSGTFSDSGVIDLWMTNQATGTITLVDNPF